MLSDDVPINVLLFSLFPTQCFLCSYRLVQLYMFDTWRKLWMQTFNFAFDVYSFMACWSWKISCLWDQAKKIKKKSLSCYLDICMNRMAISIFGTRTRYTLNKRRGPNMVLLDLTQFQIQLWNDLSGINA